MADAAIQVALSLHADAYSEPDNGLPSIDALWCALRSPTPDVVARVGKIRNMVADLAKVAEPMKAQKDKLKKLKSMLPAVTISGRFSRKGEDGFIEHSGFYVYDYDHVGDAETLMQAMVDSGLEHVVGSFISPSGAGVKVVLQGPVAASQAEHKAAWDHGLRLLRNAVPYEAEQFDAAREVSRLCYLSDCRAANSIRVSDWYEPFVVGARLPSTSAVVEGLADIPDSMVEVGGMTAEQVRERLSRIDADCDYQTWVKLVMAVVQTLGKTPESMEVVEKWSQTRAAGAWTKDEKRTFDTLWKNSEQRKQGAGVDHRYIDRLARKAGWRDWFADLRREVQKDGKVKIVACEYNIGIILDHHPELRGRIWHDEVTGASLLEPAKGFVLPHGGVIEEHLAWTIVEWLQTNWAVKVVAADGMMKAMFAKAMANSRNKRREWLRSLKWDGVARISGLWVEGFGAPDTPLNRAVAETWMIAAAARTLRPGTDFQLVPILQGPQGRGKSLGISALCPERSWVIDSQVDMRSKSGYEVVRTGTIVELAELASMGRAEVEAVKAFVSHRVITYRSPYDRQSHTLPVSWVFVGSTNEHEVLKDSTGNRRFVPIAAPGRQGYFENTVKWVEGNREQLWAEAAHKAVNAGASVVLPAEHWEAARAAAMEATVRDMAEDAIEELSVNAVDGVKMKMSDIISQVPGASMGNVADTMRVGRYLHKYGWRRTTARVEGKLSKLWVRTNTEL